MDITVPSTSTFVSQHPVVRGLGALLIVAGAIGLIWVCFLAQVVGTGWSISLVVSSHFHVSPMPATVVCCLLGVWGSALLLGVRRANAGG